MSIIAGIIGATLGFMANESKVSWDDEINVKVKNGYDCDALTIEEFIKLANERSKI